MTTSFPCVQAALSTQYSVRATPEPSSSVAEKERVTSEFTHPSGRPETVVTGAVVSAVVPPSATRARLCQPPAATATAGLQSGSVSSAGALDWS
jgi:hypothetical protein